MEGPEGPTLNSQLFGPPCVHAHVKNALTATEPLAARQKHDLWHSLAIDALGLATYLVPGLGETADWVMAPLLALWLRQVHGTWAGAAVELAEELLPGTDFIPTATLTWIYRYWLKKPAQKPTSGQ
jgi:hypothetical protein